ncbi:DUF4365 domain-containing protein [Halomonas sp. DP5N14-9]|uniref:DUF4365 domain-containing protein n=1 Tax=Halomonas sp. DP5N14-9 TaxID=2859075 RepID=UPI001C991587|nr:DUF4365 domain-containing protein [Halomonas sp. DP5N14-9]MBY5941247.1 DUF4365 domain-containing protein [Halomonas sp. DP5N14-9]
MFEKSFPIRCPNHIRETCSFKVFSNNIPNHWLIREVTERDYGIDALIEVVEATGQVTGEFISIQLKSKKTVPFNDNGKFRNYSINKNNTNYWLNSNLVTFIILVDEETSLMYMKSVDIHVRENYDRYRINDNFYYDFYSCDLFSVNELLRLHAWSKSLRSLDRELCSFDKVHRVLCDLYDSRIRRDYHMLVDEDDVLSDFDYVYQSMQGFCLLLNICWDIPEPRAFVDNNPIGIDAAYGPYFMYEYHMTKLLLMLDKKMVELLKLLHQLILTDYYQYWVQKQCSFVNFLNNVSLVSMDERYWSSK